MSYAIDAGMWSAVFAVPTIIVDEHIRMCPPLSLRILLWMLRHPGVTVDVQTLSKTLMFPQNDITDALQYWISAGILQNNDLPAQEQEQANIPSSNTMPPREPAVSTPVLNQTTETLLVNSADGAAPTTQKITTLSAQRPRLSRTQITEMSENDISIGALLNESQDVLGHPLSPLDSEILVSLYSYYGFPVEVVLMLLQYCVSVNKANMHYVEKIAAIWNENQINTLERAEEAICSLTRNNENEKKILNAFGIYNRSLTSREREYVAKWFMLGMDEHLLALACERSVENTGKPSFAYADKIISSWREKGISTVQEAVKDLKSNAGKKRPVQNVSAQTGDSSIDKDELHELLHNQFLGED